MSILILDVYYFYNSSGATCGRAAGVLFKDFSSTTIDNTWTRTTYEVADYIPGEFYRRELPCLTSLLREIRHDIDIESEIECIIVDGYTHYNNNGPGMGERLWEYLEKKIPVIGIAKKKFKGDQVSIETHRGKNATKPLWITSKGIPQDLASFLVIGMAGEDRKPMMVTKVDQLSRKGFIE